MKTLLLISVLIAFGGGAFGQNVERMFQTDVKIYLQQSGVAPNGAADLGLRPVERMVPADFKLQFALEALFAEEISDEEEDDGFSSSTFGMKLEGVSYKRGLATIRFSQPSGDERFDGLEPMIFTEAITKTARQFRFVRRVTICAVGRTTIDATSQTPFPRCARAR